METEVRARSGRTYDAETEIILSFPEARGHRRFGLSGERAEIVAAEPFEQIRFVEDHRAFFSPDERFIAAAVVTLPSPFQLHSLPNVEVIVEAEPRHASATHSMLSEPKAWKLTVADDESGIEFEIGTHTEFERILLGFRASRVVRIRNVDVPTEADARRVLEHTVRSVSFDMDVLHNVTLQLMPLEERRRRFPGERPLRALRYPKNSYEQDALTLYHYGRQARHLPLLEFLAYYQTVEHFFTVFSREEAFDSLRSTLMSPAFDPSDDQQIGRLLNLTDGSSLSLSEGEQLRLTVRRCLSERDLMAFLKDDEDRWEHFTETSKITGAKKLDPNNRQADMRDQFAARVYAIRCRIVHAKSDGGGREKPMLPASKEAKSLHHDIDALRYLAQQVLIARAARS